MSVKNNKREESKKNIVESHNASKATSDAIQFPLAHTITSSKDAVVNSRSFTRYSLDDNGGGYLGL